MTHLCRTNSDCWAAGRAAIMELLANLHKKSDQELLRLIIYLLKQPYRHESISGGYPNETDYSTCDDLTVQALGDGADINICIRIKKINDNWYPFVAKIDYKARNLFRRKKIKKHRQFLFWYSKDYIHVQEVIADVWRKEFEDKDILKD